MGHGPGFWAHISGDDLYDKAAYPTDTLVPGGKLIEMMQRYQNLYLDLSAQSGLNALKRDPGFSRTFLIEYQDRALYGRDYIDNELQLFLDNLKLPDDVMDKIYCKNALKLVP